jgi:hypothetical protein
MLNARNRWLFKGFVLVVELTAVFPTKLTHNEPKGLVAGTKILLWVQVHTLTCSPVFAPVVFDVIPWG